MFLNRQRWDALRPNCANFGFGWRADIPAAASLVIARARPYIEHIADNRFRKRRRLRDQRAPAYQEESGLVDLNELLDRHQRSLMRVDNAVTDEERRAHRQFAYDYGVQIRMVRDKRGAGSAICGFPT
jgi:hypothetical protein